MESVSPLAWILIGFIALLVISGFASLFSMAWRKESRPARPWWVNAWRGLTHPWEAEDQQLDELSRRVASLSRNDSADTNDPHP
jgi:hypothetical protein